MNEPKNYKSTQAYGAYTPLEPGGYVCTIMKVEETESSTHKPMLKIHLDIAEGANRGYFAAQYKSDTRDNKRWGCTVNQLTEDNEGNCSRGLKTFIESVTASNKGFDPNTIWGEQFAECFKGKRVGGLFRKEQYENNKGELKWSTKCFAFRPSEGITEVERPEDKLLNNIPKYGGYRDSGFSEIDLEEELPF